MWQFVCVARPSPRPEPEKTAGSRMRASPAEAALVFLACCAGALAATAAEQPYAWAQGGARMTSPPQQHVGVIGSGFAGLTAACELRKLGYEVTVFEKNAVTGGRARELKAKGGFTFDMGPSWCAHS